MRWHLAPAGARVILGSNGLEKHFERRDAQHQAERAIAVVGVKPINARTKKQPHCRGHGFVAGTGNLEENLVLALELDFPVIQPPGEIHRAVDAHQRFAIEAVILRGVKLGYLDARLYRHSVCPRSTRRFLPCGSLLYRMSFRRCYSKSWNFSSIESNPGSSCPSRLGEAPLKGSSDGMRSTQRW